MTNPDASFQMGYTYYVSSNSNQRQNPEVTMTIICIIKASITSKTIVGNFMKVFKRKKKTLEAHWISTALSYFLYKL